MVPPRLLEEKLYLSKNSDGEVFISEEFAPHLKSFQRDGIRFLYRQFRKNRAGAILNDPPGHGKTVQVVLALEALRAALRPRPCLVLCSARELSHWKYHFHVWTDSADDNLDDSNNTFSNKDIFVCPISNVAEMSRRDWGIVVVDEPNAVAYLKQLKKLSAKFKIWLTSESVEDNLQSLSSIYGWIDPKDKFDLKSYEKTGLSKGEQVEKDIALDIFCEDLILRRTRESVPLVNEEKHNELFQKWKSDKSINRHVYFNSSHFEHTENNELVKQLHAKTGDCIDQSALKNESVNQFDAKSNTNTRKIASNTSKNTPKVSEMTQKNKDATGLKIKRTKKPISGNSEKTRNNIQEVEITVQDIASKKPRLCETTAVSQTYDFNNKDIHENKVNHEILNVEDNNNKIDAAAIKDCSVKNYPILENSSESNLKITEENAIISSTGDKSVHNVKDTGEVLDDVSVSNCKNKISSDITKNVSSKHGELNSPSNEAFSLKTKNLIDSVKKMEELTNKQFKGSLLDSLF